MAVSDCTRACRYCGASFKRTAKGQPTKYCGIECRDRAQRGWKGSWRCTHVAGGVCAAAGCDRLAKTCGYCQSHYHRMMDGRDVDGAITVRPKREPKACATCAKPMLLTPYHAARKNYCSLTCAGLARRSTGQYSPTVEYKRRRRARIREGDQIDPIKVFERDHWRCTMCKRRTPKSLRGSLDPRAPELDHIVALAIGGTHTWDNVQCACRQCNGLKGAAAMGQLVMPFAA